MREVAKAVENHFGENVEVKYQNEKVEVKILKGFDEFREPPNPNVDVIGGGFKASLNDQVFILELRNADSKTD